MSRLIRVNPNQKGNPILGLIKTFPWDYEDIVPDYVVGESNAVLFLSLKYYRLHPEYILPRIRTISNFKLKILLVLSDIQANQQAIRELTKICVDHKVTMLVAWSDSDAAKYIEVLKQYENKTPDLIRERIEEDPFSKVTIVHLVI
jgi:DNA excision repair protein ERCC-1